MRPATLAEAIQRVLDGTPQEKALPEFLDTFYLAPTADAQLASLSERPPDTGNARLDALAGAIAEYLSRQYALARDSGLGVRTQPLSRPRLACFAAR